MARTKRPRTKPFRLPITKDVVLKGDRRGHTSLDLATPIGHVTIGKRTRVTLKSAHGARVSLSHPTTEIVRSIGRIFS